MALEPTMSPAASLIAPTKMFAAPAMSTVPRVDARFVNAAPLWLLTCRSAWSAPGSARYAWSGLPAGSGVVGWDAGRRLHVKAAPNESAREQYAWTRAAELAGPGVRRAGLRRRAARNVDRAGRSAGRAGPGGGVGGGGACRERRIPPQPARKDGTQRAGRRPAHARGRAVAGGCRDRAGLRAGRPQGVRPPGRAGRAAHRAAGCRAGRPRMAGRATGSGADRAAVRGTEHGRGGYRHGSRHGAGTPAGRCPAARCTPGSARMSWFLAAALVLQVALIPCAWVCWRFDSEHRVVALGMAGTVQALAVLCLAVGYGEPGLASLAVVLAALSSGGSVAFARFLERWL